MTDLFSPEGFEETGRGPLYVQLSRRIADGIATGRLTPGESLPPERDMAAMTGLSRVTVRKAVQALVASGQLIQKRGSGTYVAPKVERLEQALQLNAEARGDLRRFEQTDVGFHYALAAITGNPILAAVHDALVEWLTSQRTIALSMPGVEAAAFAAHQRIFAAVRAGDANAAGDAMGQHLQEISEIIRNAAAPPAGVATQTAMGTEA